MRVRDAVDDTDDIHDESASALDVTIDGDRRSLRWPSGMLLVDALLSQGIDAPHSCREGRCAACICRIESGTVELLRNHVLTDEQVHEGWILACQTLPRSASIHIDFDQA